LKGSVTAETFKEPTQREEAKKAIKKHLEERYARGANRWCTWDCVSLQRAVC
jgi:large subunit ribosomal protein L27e